jgi:hypothetical protein
MGRGCALQAKEAVPGVEYKLGGLLAEHGNRVMRLAALPDGSRLGTFPVKHRWREAADLELIERSARQLVELADLFGYQRLFAPSLKVSTKPALRHFWCSGFATSENRLL